MRTRKLLVTAAFMAIALIAVPTIAGAQTELPGNIYLMSRLLNFSRGQAVSIDFCNVGRVTREVRIYFVDVNGNVIKSAVKRAAPGQTVDVLLNFADMPRNGTARAGVRGVVVIPGTQDGQADVPEPDLSLANMEVYDVQTGRTSFGLLLPAIKSLNVYFPTDQ